MPRQPLSSREIRRGKALGARIRSVRLASALSQEQVAARADISLDTYRSIESGRTAAPSVFIVAAICRALKIDLRSVANLPL